MIEEEDLLRRIKSLVVARQYRIKIHAVRHMIEEGFTESNVLEALEGKCKLLENYHHEKRCLIVGYFFFTKTARSPLHIVCDYSVEGLIDIITAYIPQRPWWITPTKRGRRQ